MRSPSYAGFPLYTLQSVTRTNGLISILNRSSSRFVTRSDIPFAFSVNSLARFATLFDCCASSFACSANELDCCVNLSAIEFARSVCRYATIAKTIVATDDIPDPIYDNIPSAVINEAICGESRWTTYASRISTPTIPTISHTGNAFVSFFRFFSLLHIDSCHLSLII